MSINAYSSYATYLGNVAGFKNLQTSLAELTQQLNTGKKSVSLVAYGVQGSRLLDLRAEIQRREGYLDTIKAVTPDIKAYDKVFNSMEKLAGNMYSAFLSPLSDPPTAQQNKITFDGNVGDVGDIYKVTVDGKLYSYITSGLEGSVDDITGNLVDQINAEPGARVMAKVVGEDIVITATEVGATYNVGASVTNVTGGGDNTVSTVQTKQGKVSPIVGQIDSALQQMRSLLNEQINDRFLFGGLTANDRLPVVDLSRLPDPSGSANAATSSTAQQLAAGTAVQQVRITTDYLGSLQSETFTINAQTFTFNGPLTAQQLADQLRTAINASVPLTGVVSVSDVDANGLTITAVTPGTAFSTVITGTDPTPSKVATVKPNVPIGLSQVDLIQLSGPVGTINETFSVTIMDPPNNALPVTIDYTTTGDEKSLDEIAVKLIEKINAYQPPFTVTVTAPGYGRIQLSSTTAFESHGAVQDSGSVTTTQRTVVPVAQEDEVTFPGPFGDNGDVYTVNFTSPVGGPFTVTTTNLDDDQSIAQKFAGVINAANIGVTAGVKGGKLALESDTPGTPFTYTAVLTTDVGTVSAAPTTATVIANIPAGPLPQIDTVALSGPLGRKGDAYELTVNGRTIRYTTTGNERDMDAIAINLVALVNAAVPAMPVSATAGATGTGTFTLTSTAPGTVLDTSFKVIQPTVVGNPVAPIYNEHQEPLDSANAWERGKVTIADQLTLRSTFSANEIGFQKLQLALRYAQSAVNDLDNYQEKIEIARGLTNDALTSIRALHADNTVNDAVITATTLSHQTSINLYTDGSAKIEEVDRNEVAAKIDVAQTQLQAIFAVMGTTNQISLVNFLA
ncbi:MAG: hypothetical protein IPK59_17870 [Rhodospirillaceae bacterium]|nr:hypothetical protein [Rhodospirillaceae bacterium]